MERLIRLRDRFFVALTQKHTGEAIRYGERRDIVLGMALTFGIAVEQGGDVFEKLKSCVEVSKDIPVADFVNLAIDGVEKALWSSLGLGNVRQTGVAYSEKQLKDCETLLGFMGIDVAQVGAIAEKLTENPDDMGDHGININL
jgi:hypothetical protein